MRLAQQPISSDELGVKLPAAPLFAGQPSFVIAMGTYTGGSAEMVKKWLGNGRPTMVEKWSENGRVLRTTMVVRMVRKKNNGREDGRGEGPEKALVFSMVKNGKKMVGFFHTARGHFETTPA